MTPWEADEADLVVENHNRQQRQRDLDRKLREWSHRPAVIDDQQPGRET